MRLAVLVAAIFLSLVCATGGSPALGPNRGSLQVGPLQTALMDPDEFGGADATVAFKRSRDSGATIVRLLVRWDSVVGGNRPADPSNPADPSYDWAAVDRQVTGATAAGLQPILSIFAAPEYALRAAGRIGLGGDDPDPAEFALFAHAAAVRYSGSFGGLPRVRFWQAWNEPNITLYLAPQFKEGRPYSPILYREMVNRFADAVKGVHADNVVVAGGLAPFYDNTPEVMRLDPDWGPLSFMRELLCLSKDLTPTCDNPIRFDVWSTHPYTSGGPLHQAILPNDVSLGDLPEMRSVLNAALAANHVRSDQPVRFWVTEFAWDSNPPNPLGVPPALLTRWVAESLYRMWQNGVSLVTWLTLRDHPMNISYLQCGLYYRGDTIAADRPKPSLEAFRFPVVAFPSGSRTSVWGRTPWGKPGKVVLEQKRRTRWKRIAVVVADRNGIFRAFATATPRGIVRATLWTGEHSVPFSLTPVPDQRFYPFGLTFLEPYPGR